MADSEKQKCLAYLSEAVEKNPTVRFMLERLEKAGCNFTKEELHCQPCNIDVAGGFTINEKQPKVVLCENHLFGKSHAHETLVHELIHAYDQCRAKIIWDDCKHHACSEIRASALSGECSFSNEIKRGHFKFIQHHKACVRRRAVLSVSKNPCCTPEEAAIAVDQVFDNCYRDTRPFERMPH